MVDCAGMFRQALPALTWSWAAWVNWWFLISPEETSTRRYNSFFCKVQDSFVKVGNIDSFWTGSFQNKETQTWWWQTTSYTCLSCCGLLHRAIAFDQSQKVLSAFRDTMTPKSNHVPAVHLLEEMKKMYETEKGTLMWTPPGRTHQSVASPRMPRKPKMRLRSQIGAHLDLKDLRRSENSYLVGAWILPPRSPTCLKSTATSILRRRRWPSSYGEIRCARCRRWQRWSWAIWSSSSWPIRTLRSRIAWCGWRIGMELRTQENQKERSLQQLILRCS